MMRLDFGKAIRKAKPGSEYSELQMSEAKQSGDA
jgi:hypothetical protein